MPANFPTAEQKRYYGRYVEAPTPDQLGQHFHLTETDFFLIYGRTKEHTQLGIAVQIGTVRFLGLFLPDSQWHTVPLPVVQYAAAQLGIAPDLWLEYVNGRRATIGEHQALIRQRYGYRDFTDESALFSTIRWLYARAWLHDEPPSRLFDLLVLWLKQRKILLPGITTLEELINHIRDQAARRAWARLDKQLTETQRQTLQTLVTTENREQSALDRLRDGPTSISSDALKVALERIKELRQMEIGNLDISWLALDRLKKLARHAGLSKADTINRLKEPRKWATLAAFVYAYETRAVDDALDVFDSLVQTRLTRVGNQGKKKRLRTLRDLDAAARHLGQTGTLLLALDPTQPIILNDVLFHVISREQLTVSVSQVDALTRPPDDNYYELLLNHYNQFRRFLPTFWYTLTFKGLESEADLLEAIQFLKGLEAKNLPALPKVKKQQLIDEAPQGVITSAWQSYVIDQDGHIHLHYYTFCVLLQLRDALRRRSVFVTGSERWGDIRDKLLPDATWQKVKTQVCRSLGLPTFPETMVTSLENQLDTAYKHTGDNLPENTKARLEKVKDKTRFILEPLGALADPDSLIALRRAVHDLLPRVNIAEIIQEVAAWTGCLADFIHISEGPIRARDIYRSLCAVLLAEATNLGLAPFVDASNPALTRGRLTWVRHNYIRTETIVKANARLVAMQDTIPLAHAWGGGEVAVADGLRFVVPVRSAHAGASHRYFGMKRGITWYHWMVDQQMDIHGIPVAGALKDAPYVLDGLLEQETHHRPKELITDTGGYSDIVFGLFRLLGYRFSPRLADLGDARFWRLDRDADYGVLNGLARHKVKPDLFIDNWNDVLHATGSLQMGTVKASELIKSLHRAGRTSTLGQAIGEIGRIEKTLFLLSWVDDETYRRRTFTQLTRIEHRHRLANAIRFDREGKMYQKYREGQEDQLNALGLVLNMVVLWTTRYMNAALDYLRETGFDVREEDLERLSPLVSHHINFVGKYHFSLPEEVKRGELRPFYNPNDPANII
ncbi:MAG: Tn3 family transposase [Anaerolineales bacterium]|nr:Tn3 family transposase [Anaerolineales bacterium]